MPQASSQLGVSLFIASMRRTNVAGGRGGDRCLTDCLLRMFLQRVQRGLSGNTAAQELRHYSMEEAFNAAGTTSVSVMEKSIDSYRGIYKSARKFMDGQIQHFLKPIGWRSPARCSILVTPGPVWPGCLSPKAGSLPRPSMANRVSHPPRKSIVDSLSRRRRSRRE